MTGSKRRVEQVDLTASDDENRELRSAVSDRKRARQWRRPSPSASDTRSSQVSRRRTPLADHSSFGTSQPDRDAFLAPSQPSSSSQFDASAEVEDESQVFDDNALQSSVLYGVLQAKVVGIQYYRGHAMPGEFVVLRREPSNPYDSNAIRVDNAGYTQIGHIPRGIAAKLAPLIDDNSLIVEGSLAGYKGVYDVPLTLNLYGTSDGRAMQTLKERMKSVRLPVNVVEKEQREQQKRAKEVAKQRERQRKEMLKNIARGAGSAHVEGSGNPTFANITMPGDDPDSPDMDDILATATAFDPREIQSIANKYAASEERLSQMPEASQPPQIRTRMLPYQLQGLAWMLEQENPKLPKPGSPDTVQLWKHNSNKTFTNVATSYTVGDPKLASGGILADDMGLGKTLQVISLIMADPRRNNKPTLILAPLSVMSNWSSQIEMHVAEEKALKVMTYHGTQRSKAKASDLRACDVVITTYQTLASEYFTSRKHSALYNTAWRRIVVDEGHNLRNPKAKMSVAACGVDAQSKWVLTGTPIVNNLKDLYSHVKFIGLTGGLEKFDVFNGTLVRPLNQGRADAGVLLQALMTTLCLRRMKDMAFVDLRLPKISSHKYSVTFKPHEREKYDAFAQEAKGLLLDFQRKKTDGSKAYSSLLEVLLRMRQTCNHWELTGSRLTELLEAIGKSKKVALNGANIQTLQGLLQLSIDNQEDCPVCLDTLHDPVITACAHSFGRDCIERVIETQHKCPMCRASLETKDELVESAAAGESISAADKKAEEMGLSSKVEALLDILKASAKKGSSTKTVVFSQWTSFLDVVARHLGDAGFRHCRLDGTMRPERRDEAMRELAADPACTVMLASLGVCSVGLNLTAADQVVLADSWWAPAVEDQAVDRVYRLGQRRAVRVFRLVAEGTVEERVLEVQADKRKLMAAAFGERRAKRAEGSARLADIERLLQ